MAAKLEDGWLRVPYTGPEITLIEIGLSGDWHPAFLDWAGGQRVAQIRPPAGLAGSFTVAVRGGGRTVQHGQVRL
jgi:hypothetical protein